MSSRRAGEGSGLLEALAADAARGRDRRLPVLLPAAHGREAPGARSTSGSRRWTRTGSCRCAPPIASFRPRSPSGPTCSGSCPRTSSIAARRSAGGRPAAGPARAPRRGDPALAGGVRGAPRGGPDALAAPADRSVRRRGARAAAAPVAARAQARRFLDDRLAALSDRAERARGGCRQRALAVPPLRPSLGRTRSSPR